MMKKCVPSAVVSYAPWLSSRALGSGRHNSLQQGFRSRGKNFFFSHLLPGLAEEWEEKKDLFDEKTGRIWPNVEMSSRAKFTSEYVVIQFWVSFVEDKCDLDNAIQTKAEFSYATAVMGRIGGWEKEECEQENWVRFAGSIWIYTTAVVCNGQSHMQNFRIFK